MQPADIAPRDGVIVPLDLPDVEAAEAMVARLGDSVTFYKIGYQLAYAGGLPLVSKLADQGSLEGIVSGKRRLRVREAESALMAARSNRDDALRLLRFQVAQAFYGVLAAQASESADREVAGTFAQTLDLIGVRYWHTCRLCQLAPAGRQHIGAAVADMVAALGLDDDFGAGLLRRLDAILLHRLLTTSQARRPQVNAIDGRWQEHCCVDDDVVGLTDAWIGNPVISKNASHLLL